MCVFMSEFLQHAGLGGGGGVASFPGSPLAPMKNNAPPPNLVPRFSPSVFGEGLGTRLGGGGGGGIRTAKRICGQGVYIYEAHSLVSVFNQLSIS